jgi:hypothetical protein
MFFFFCKCFWATLGTKNSLTSHDKHEFKLGFDFGPKLELGFFFPLSLNASKLLLVLTVSWWNMDGAWVFF